MYKVKFNKVVALGLMLTILAVSAPAAMAGGSYLGANGQSYQNDDFWYDDFEVTASQLDGKASFCWQHPSTYFEGYDVFATEGSFVGGLTNYEPKTVSKNTKCYTYPKQFNADTTVSIHVYPYIELASGARKYIQPGDKVIAPVKAVDDSNVWLDAVAISATSTTNSINVFWDDLAGKGDTFTKYKVMYKKGYHYSMPSSAAESFVSFNYFNWTGLSAGESWTFQVVPVKWENGDYVEVGSRSNLLHVGTLTEEDNDVEAMNLWIDSWNNKMMPQIAWSEFTDQDFDAYLVTVRKGTSWKNSKAVVYHYPDKTDTSLQLGTLLKANESYLVQIAPYNAKNGLAYVIEGAESNILKFKTGALSGGGSNNGTIYEGKDGTTYTEADFLNSNTVLKATALTNNKKAYFSWTKPGKAFDGYALYVTEGEFSDLENYNPIYLNKNKAGYMYPKKFKANTQVSAYIYPYIELSNGARKFIQSGSQASVMVKVKKDVSLSAPKLVKPKNNVVLTSYPRKASFLWTKVKNASSYEVEIACDVCTSTTTKWLNPTTYTTKKTSFMTPALAGDNQFRFRVRALAANGSAGSWSEYRYFWFDTSK